LEVTSVARLNVVGIGGSLARVSSSLAALRIAVEGAGEGEVDTRVLDIISGSFKNALDWLHVLGDRTPPFLTDKIVGLVSTAGGVHGLQAVNTMEFVVRALRGWAVPLVVPIPQAPRAFDDAGRPRDPQLEAQLRQLGREVTRAARQMAAHGVCD
jgi:FMN reductase